jgi:hypothetical protein
MVRFHQYCTLCSRNSKIPPPPKKKVIIVVHKFKKYNLQIIHSFKNITTICIETGLLIWLLRAFLYSELLALVTGYVHSVKIITYFAIVSEQLNNFNVLKFCRFVFIKYQRYF